MNGTLKRTPLYDVHRSLGARLVEFGGWEMPVHYTNIIEEHLAVRSNVGIFDLSHMGQIEIRGEKAFSLVQNLVTNDVAKLVDGQVLYTPMCTETGGIVDDLLVYRFSANFYMLVVNASNVDKDFDWIRAHSSNSTEVCNRSAETVLIALQGPNAAKILQTFTEVNLQALRYYYFTDGNIAGIPAIISRTGYTGEIGLELYVDASLALGLWDILCEAVVRAGGKAVGLGARDLLRLEMKFCLYGNEIDETTTPLEAGLDWTVAFGKGDFIGDGALQRQHDAGVERRLVGFQMLDRSIARSQYKVYREGLYVGHVTSGAPSLSLGCNIGLAYLPLNQSRINSRIEIEIRGKRHPAKVVRTPFYEGSNRGSAVRTKNTSD